MWNLEKLYRLTVLQGINRATDVDNKRMDNKGGKLLGWWWWEELRDWDWHVNIYMYKIDNQ